MNILQHKTLADWEADLGQQFRALRLSRNIDQIAAADGAGVGLSAIKNLEAGRGTTLKTMIKVLRFLGRTDWLEALSPPISISPLQIARNKSQRIRAFAPRKRPSTEQKH